MIGLNNVCIFLRGSYGADKQLNNAYYKHDAPTERDVLIDDAFLTVLLFSNKKS